jgi:hypothetical protein
MSNIIGAQLDSYVLDQIAIRQEAQGSGVDSERTLDQLAYLNSRTSWIKLASSVSVDEDVLKGINLLTFKADLKNKGLAENNVLFGGTSILQDKSLSPIEDSSTSFNTVRSSGMSGYENSSDYGVIPMAGIESVDVKTLNRGSIEKANIKIKAYSKEQFNIIETLYLRLGYTLLLEWGNSSYLKKDGKIGNVNSTLVEDPNGFFKKEKHDDPQRMYTSIDSLREKHKGNYDAMLGKISNFSWSFEKDGSFDITITLISLGDVIESLKINVNPSRTIKEFMVPLQSIDSDDDDALDKNKNANSISSMLWLYKYVNYDLSKQTPIAIVDGGGNQHGMGNWCKKESTSGGVSGYKVTAYKIGMRNFVNPGNLAGYGPYLQFFGYDEYPRTVEDFKVTDEELEGKYGAYRTTKENNRTFPLADSAPIQKWLESLKPDLEGKEACYIYTVEEITIIPEDNPLNNFGDRAAFYLDTLNTPSFYLRFGELLDFINNRVISKIDTKTTPHSNNTKLISIDTGQYTNRMYAISDMISLDPRVCLIRNNNFGKGPSRGVAKVFQQLKPFLGVDYRSVGGENYGYIMNIYLNFDFILESLNSNTDDKGSVALLPFLTSICDKVSEALGGINNLEPVIDKNNSGLKIIDSTPIPGLITDGPNKIEVFGYNSNNSSNFVRNIDLKTAITPEYATMITVGATAGGYVKGTDATAFSKWNAGLTDRFKQDLLPAVIPNDDDPKSADKDPEEVYQLDFLKGILKCYGFKIGGDGSNANPLKPPRRNWTGIEMQESFIKSNLSVASEYYKYLHSQNKDKTGGTTGFIPFKLSLTVDGISGVKIYNKLEVDTRFLPVNYGNTLNFIVTGVSHKLNNNDWETQIETTVMPKTEVLSIQSTVSSSAYVGGGGGVSDEKTLTSGWPMKSSQYSKTNTVKSQIYLHHDAFYQRSDKGKGCASILANRGVSCHAMIDIDGHIEHMFDDKYISYCQGLVQPSVPDQIWPNATGLSIEIAGLGYEGQDLDYSIGEPLVNCVDWNGNTIAEYKSHKKYQEYSDAQIVALKGLLKRWVTKHNIPFSYDEATYKMMFPKKGSNSPEVAKGKPGIWTHNSVDSEKSDVFPSPKLIKLFKELSIELNS